MRNSQPVRRTIPTEDYLIGGCGFDGFQVGKSHRAEIGYWLATRLVPTGTWISVIEGLLP